MCETKTVLIVAALLLAATGLCIYQAKSEKKVAKHREIKSESPRGKSTKSIVWTEANAIIHLAKTLQAVTVHGYMEESGVKKTCGGLR